MVKVNVDGYSEFVNAVSQHKDKDIFVLFCGSKAENGVSWCPDCVKGER